VLTLAEIQRQQTAQAAQVRAAREQAAAKRAPFGRQLQLEPDAAAHTGTPWGLVERPSEVLAQTASLTGTMAAQEAAANAARAAAAAASENQLAAVVAAERNTALLETALEEARLRRAMKASITMGGQPARPHTRQSDTTKK
jgi:hypothetical protein